MKSFLLFSKGALFGVLAGLIASLTYAQSAATWVDVGPAHAGGGGSASGSFQHVDSHTNTVPGGSVAQALAVGTGTDGFAISHSIGVNTGGRGSAHNFNMAVGPGGSHVSHGSVQTTGGESRVMAAGGSYAGSRAAAPAGGSQAIGFGRRASVQSYSATHPIHPPLLRPQRRAWGGPRSALSPLSHFGRPF